ncbi:MAG: polysaccharide deacetylase family protein [Pseudomonadota bacterium]
MQQIQDVQVANVRIGYPDLVHDSLDPRGENLIAPSWCRLVVCLTSVLLVFCLSACVGSGTAVTQSEIEIVAKDQAFTLVALNANQTAEDVAHVLLGSKDEVWQIYEVNDVTNPAPGEILAVPNSPLNVTGVYQHHYRTVPILCYHQFTNGHTAGHRLEVTAREFEKQISYLVNEGYQFLTFAELADIVYQRRAVPEKSVVITVDDGYESVFDVAWPILKRYRVNATLFVYTDFVGGGAAMSWKQLKQLQDSGLIEIESHGKSHSSLAKIEEDTTNARYESRLKQEIDGSEAAFEKRLALTPNFISYPYGNSSITIANLLEERGYQLAATVTRGPNGSFVDPFLLHRTMIYSDHDLADFTNLLRVNQTRR